jgi:hypothetical protein
MTISKYLYGNSLIVKRIRVMNGDEHLAKKAVLIIDNDIGMLKMVALSLAQEG